MNRQTAPEISAIENIHTGFPDSKDNLYRIDSEAGVFKLEIVYPKAGYSAIPNKLHGIYGMDLLLSGTKERTATQIAEEIDMLGAYVFKACDYYSSSLTLFGLNDNIDQILSITRAAAENCSYEKNELDVYKSKKVSELNINLNKTSFLANRKMNELLFGSEHPFAKASDIDSIQAVTPADLLKTKSEALNEPYYIFTGPSSIDIQGILRNNGYEIKGLNSDKAVTAEIMPAGKTAEAYSEKKGSTQNSIRFGKIVPSRSHPDYFKMNLFNLIFGGFFGSRLMKNIREEKGLTYGIHSSITPFRNYCMFRISSECNQQLSETVKTEILKELKQLQEIEVSEEELTVAKNYLSGALLRSFDGAFNISERFKSALDLETDDNYYKRYFESIQSTSAEDIRECANNYFDSETLSYCIAGEM